MRTNQLLSEDFRKSKSLTAEDLANRAFLDSMRSGAEELKPQPFKTRIRRRLPSSEEEEPVPLQEPYVPNAAFDQYDSQRNQLPLKVVYRAYHKGPYDPRQDEYRSLDIYEIQAHRWYLDRKVLYWQRKEWNQRIGRVAGPDRIVVGAFPPRTHWANVGTDYVVIPDRLVARRRYNVQSVYVDEFIAENEHSEGEGVIFAGEIEGIAIIREVMEITTELPYLHPIVGDRGIKPGLKSTDESYYNYEENFQAIECGYQECSYCYASLHVLAVDDEPPMKFTVGESIYKTEVADENKQRKQRFAKLKRMRRILKASMISLMSLPSLQSLLETLDTIDAAEIEQELQDAEEEGEHH
jgi:hypothetical protein